MKGFIFLLLAGLSVNSFAHDFSGVLPADASAVDYLVVTCSVDGSMTPDRLVFKITSPDATPLLSAQVAKGTSVTNITPSRGSVDVSQGEGAYRVTVDKNGAGIVSYSIEYHCMSNNDHTETSIERK